MGRGRNCSSALRASSLPTATVTAAGLGENGRAKTEDLLFLAAPSKHGTVLKKSGPRRNFHLGEEKSSSQWLSSLQVEELLGQLRAGGVQDPRILIQPILGLVESWSDHMKVLLEGTE